MERIRGFEVLPEYAGLTEVPTRKTAKSSGYDIRAIGSYYIQPGEMIVVETGLTAYMLDDEELQLRCRSGLARRHQLSLQNGIGTIDADYYGEHIEVLIRNDGHEVFAIEHGDRIAQGVFTKFLVVDNDNASGERTGGFGHSGVK